MGREGAGSPVPAQATGSPKPPGATGIPELLRTTGSPKPLRTTGSPEPLRVVVALSCSELQQPRGVSHEPPRATAALSHLEPRQSP
ncbi:hypothetical protein TURU_008611 [Turdus rufiventris]|nr:hypothetical protein TURU_008611 [Turdus rufiventris]